MRDDFGPRRERERNGRDCFRESLTCIEKFGSHDQMPLIVFPFVPIFFYFAKYTFKAFNQVICEEDNL